VRFKSFGVMGRCQRYYISAVNAASTAIYVKELALGDLCYLMSVTGLLIINFCLVTPLRLVQPNLILFALLMFIWKFYLTLPEK
jgi:hypothetical protein